MNGSHDYDMSGKTFKSAGKVTGVKLLISILLLFLMSAPGCSGENRASRIYMVDSSASGLNNGSSWSTAYTHLQDALDQARSGDQVWVAEGIYGPQQPDGREVVRLTEGVVVLGGFSGFEGSASERDVSRHATVLDGQGTSFHVVMGADGAVLDGFTITGGKADGATAQSQYGGTFSGGGMFSAGMSIEIRNCVFTGNEAVSGGGALYSEKSRILVENSSFTHNTANFGGAIQNRGSDIYFVNTVLSYNNARLSGGAVASFDGTSLFTNSVFSGNTSTYVGGGVLNNKSESVFTNCSLTGNRADTCGGAVGAWEGGLTVVNCIIWDDKAGDGSEIHGVNTNITVEYSIVRNGYAGVGNSDSAPGFIEAGYWDVNGRWIDGDYKLAAASPAVDSGTAEGAPDFDAEYNPRPQALAHDRGAYERPGL